MRILIRTSRWAVWARRLGSVAVPFVILAVLLHRFRLITSDLFLVAALAAGLTGLAAVLMSIVALARLWQTGDQGWGRALTGLLFGAISLLPHAWYGNLALRYPPATDIATTDRSLMPLMFEPGTAAMPAPRLLPAQTLATVFPNVETRRYPLGLVPAFGVVEALVADHGWDVRLLRVPASDADVGQINAQVMTLPGWREEVVIRMTGTMTSTTLDMRSASLHALHDFGSNGLRIEQFMAEVDEAVTILLRDNPGANQPLETDDDDFEVTEEAPATP